METVWKKWKYKTASFEVRRDEFSKFSELYANFCFKLKRTDANFQHLKFKKMLTSPASLQKGKFCCKFCKKKKNAASFT